ncbi:hypothetical protein [Pasteuria penetrans]|uniref:hypothetical protein n=1 Tax=Pasteuria penetrans TaxID=86005 RepID=UPI0011EF9F10|nr:hypothetical protein [Pasteuria penetrans]
MTSDPALRYRVTDGIWKRVVSIGAFVRVAYTLHFPITVQLFSHTIAWVCFRLYAPFATV